MPTIKSLLITREPGSFKVVEAWCANHKIDFKAVSLIEIKSVLNLEIPCTDWIFFSSPKGAESYLDNYPIYAKKIAAVGSGTKNVLIKKGIAVDFCGEKTDHTPLIGQKFNALVSMNESVLFPISNRSKRSVINEIDSIKLIEINTYKTYELRQRFTAHFDAVFFTSPSNFTSFIAKNHLAENLIVIAIGKTTADVIHAYDSKIKLNVLNEPTEQALIEVLENNDSII